MSTEQQNTQTIEQNSNKKPRNRRRRPPQDKPLTDGPSSSGQNSIGEGNPIPSEPLVDYKSQSSGKNYRGQRHPPSKAGAAIAPSTVSAQTSESSPRLQEGSRRRKANFGANLTQPDDDASSKAPNHWHDKRKGKGRQLLPQGDDLASILTRDLSSPPYPDCPICFSSIRPEQAIWSCSPSIPIVVSNEAQIREYCWTSFHVKCIRSWAEKSVKEVAEARRARGELNKNGDWRCPGCQAKREFVPSGYWCFCHSTAEPKPPRLSTPHSCGSSCSRQSSCGHPCPLQCHPGPCPPCQVTTRLTCYCPRQEVLTFRCGSNGRGKMKGLRDLSCGNVCGRPLNCGKHLCQKTCHDDACGACQMVDLARCWCGKEEKQVLCATGDEVQCFVEGESPWIGRFGCDVICGRYFDCGKHRCKKPCHPPSSTPVTCPRSPLRVNCCPCGKSLIAPTGASDASQYAFPARLACSDPIPTCDSLCSKPHPSCDHPCTSVCHNGPCPPCNVQIVRPCRCGATTKTLSCCMVRAESTAEENEILCEKRCLALRACGRHQCRRICCPLASLSTVGRKGKKRAPTTNENVGIGEEPGGLHECDLVCGKMLSCGNHECELKDHKGLCPPCLRSDFEETICPCGRTIYEPPIPCGTRVECNYPCLRQRTTCEHQNIPHSCHDDLVPCPPCPHLTEKVCACGKKVMSNIRCSLETDKISCGAVCGRLMSCGFHHCERLCHSDACGICVASCGKYRKSCLPESHPCTRPCHAPSNCPESEPCQTLITLTCSCGRIKQPVQCGRTATLADTSTRASPSPKCNNDCLIAKRNAKLAEALGINTEGRDKANMNVVYPDDLANFGRSNGKFLGLVERAFADFVGSEKRTQVLPHMPPDRRKFVQDLANVYRMDSQLIDQEPHRSVQLQRRVDTRIPSPLLSTYAANTPPPPSLGKLADLRTVRGPTTTSGTIVPFGVDVASAATSSTSAGWRIPGNNVAASSSGRSTAPVVGGHRGWASVAVKPPIAVASTGMVPSAVSKIHLTGSTTVSRASSPAPLSVGDVDREQIPDDWEEDA